MKITSGYAQGMKLSIAPGLITRPTPEKVRQAIFNMLQDRLDGDGTIWDLFSGTGGIGLEALSRGLASSCLFIENNALAYKALTQNVINFRERFKKQNLNCPHIDHFQNSVEIFLKKYGTKNPPNVIWGDPPYQFSQDFLKAYSKVFHSMSLKGGLLIWEWDQTNEEMENLDGWELIKIKSYGRTQIGLWTKS
jgi:16S rRNA (guanine966-N2)-methyltransferase